MTIFLISSPIWAFFVVNFVSYDNSIFSIDFSQLSNISLSLQAKKEGIELYFSILTITGLILAIIQFLSSNEQAKTANKHAQTANDHLQESIKQTEISNQSTMYTLKQTTIAFEQLEKINKLVVTSNEQLNFSIQINKLVEEEIRKVAINGLLEEIKHNIDLIDYLNIEPTKIIKLYIEIKKSLNEQIIYPTIYLSDKWKNLMNDEFYIKKIELPEMHELTTIFEMRTNNINNAISNGFYLKHERLFLNLGHLNYSITRYNDDIKIFNNHVFKILNFILTDDSIALDKMMTIIRDDWNTLQHDYSDWLHLRLHFAVVDLLYSFDIDDFIDKEYVKGIKKIIEEE